MNRVSIVVTHLLGTGHLARALVLARAFGRAGNMVQLVSGGMDVAHFDTGGIQFEQLPALRSDGVDFTTLLQPDGQVADESYRANRRARLNECVENFAPDAVITELFPFGRRILADEFLSLLQRLRERPNPPHVFCSIRDILAPPSKSSKAQKTHDIIAEYYRAVLIHSDPTWTKLEESWPVDRGIEQKLCYTGYVAQPPSGAHPDKAGAGEVLVTAGGGGVGDDLFSTALNAAALDPSRRWRLLVGGTDAHDRVARFRASAPANASIEPARPDFRQMLHHAAASVSMCGYNTALDLLQAGTPAVFVPFDAGSEVEQGLRARALSRHDGFETLMASGADGQSMLNAVNNVIAAPKRAPLSANMDGADETVRIVTRHIEKRVL